MAEIDFVGALHRRTKRNYVQRVVDHDKAHCAAIARQFGADYWDGERQFGYGGYHYDGRWRPVAEAMAEHYGLAAGMRVLDVGAGKGYLLHELTQAVPGLEVAGLDISGYAIANAKEEVRGCLQEGNARALPWPDDHFDFVVSLGALHNLPIDDLFAAIKEIERVGKDARKYIMVESYRSEAEKTNLLYWQLTCQAFHDTREWAWLYQHLGYSGDWGFIFFE